MQKKTDQSQPRPLIPLLDKFQLLDDAVMPLAILMSECLIQKKIDRIGRSHRQNHKFATPFPIVTTILQQNLPADQLVPAKKMGCKLKDQSKSTAHKLNKNGFSDRDHLLIARSISVSL